MTHWHIYTAMPGYMSEGDEPPHAYETVEDVCNGIEEELKRLSDFASDGASNFDTQAKRYREEGNQEAELDAWRMSYDERKRGEELFVMAGDYSTDRKDAPVYVNEPEKWATEMQERIERDFPHRVTENSNLYVEGCENPECVEDEDDE